MVETKQFPLRVVLTLTTGRLLTAPKGPHNNGIGDLYELLGWMTNDEVYTHQAPRFADECKPWLLRWFPWLEAATARLSEMDQMKAETSPVVAMEWFIAEMQKTMPPTVDVPRIPQDDHERRNPIEEAIAMRGSSDGIVVVEVPR